MDESQTGAGKPRCQECQRDFVTQGGLEQHRRDRHSATSHERKDAKKHLAAGMSGTDAEKQRSFQRMKAIAFAFAVIFVLAALIYTYLTAQKGG